MPDKMLNKRMAENPRQMARSCRMRAITMRQIAGAVVDRHTREMLLRQAATWDEMADAAERRAQAVDPDRSHASSTANA